MSDLTIEVREDETPIEIPLSSTYIFQASPMDGTLKTMLTELVEPAEVHA